MHQAFVVTLDVEDNSPDSSAGNAETLREVAEDAGLQVVSVNPWNLKSAMAASQAPTISNEDEVQDASLPTSSTKPLW